MKRFFSVVACCLIVAAACCLADAAMLGTKKKAVAEGGKVIPDKPVMAMETNRGAIEIELFPKVAPKACENFINLAEKGYYDGLIFHRVIKGFMVQGGDPTGTGRDGQSIWGTPFVDECSPDLKFDGPGILAMANSGPNTNGSQFFITTVPTPWLNGKHTIFGKVIKGYEVVQAIEYCKAGPGDRPSEEQKIIKMRLKKSSGGAVEVPSVKK